VFDNEETEEEETEETRDPQRWSWIRFWSTVFAGIGAYWALWGAMWEQVSNLMDEHHEWKNGRETFAERAALEIEALTKEPAPVKAD
jgi:hypothetical protein